MNQLMTENNNASIREQVTILGELESASFVPWIERHSRKLGLVTKDLTATADRIEFELEGPNELLDAMEMGCSLGPIDVWVEEIQRTPL